MSKESTINECNPGISNEKKVGKDKDTSDHKEFQVPDGGWGWMVCIASMVVNGTVFGIINTFGIIYVYMIKEYEQNKSDISFRTSWVGSVCTGLTFLMSVLASILCDKIGSRPIALLGAILGCVGLVASAFVTQLEIHYLTFGILLGIGGSFIYTPSLSILGHYFKRHIGLVNGIVTFGSSLYSVLLSLALPILLSNLHMRYTFLILGSLYFILIISAATFKPLLPKVDTNSTFNELKNHTFNVRIWKNKSYVIWAVLMGMVLFGYFIPFVHIVKHTESILPEVNGNLLITIIHIMSGISRLGFGKVSDLHCVNRIYLQQTAILLMGIGTTCMSFVDNYIGLICIACVLGMCDGIFILLIGPVAFDIVGPEDVSQALGFLFGIYTVPVITGPPIAGYLYDHFHNYQVAFCGAGAILITSALLMCLIPKIDKRMPAVEIVMEDMKNDRY